ncbi:MAG: YicC family protein [Planctomycetes bacterium]|nr:YicC family protein [Planctomycetota bacterium]
MLLSMTGYGEARCQSEQLTLSVELRALNNRYLKVTLRAPDPYHLLEAEFEKVIRKSVKRGTIQVHLRCEHQAATEDFRINQVALASYVQQIHEACAKLGLGDQEQAILSQVVMLPGVVPEGGSRTYQLHEDWAIIEKVLHDAIDRLQAMRKDEGAAMAQELLSHRDTIARHLDVIRKMIPQVVTTFRDRLYEKVRALLSELDVKIDRNDLIREVSIFSERSDIAEEVVRLATHLDHFQGIMNEDESPGRKLEFLTQEMSRETNTIGSKASDVEISRQVVEIKGTLEKIRELIQNVE